jgi:hypothetical protein
MAKAKRKTKKQKMSIVRHLDHAESRSVRTNVGNASTKAESEDIAGQDSCLIIV